MVTPLVFEVDGEFTNLVAEVIVVPSELLNSEAVEDLVIVDGGDEAKCYAAAGVFLAASV